jgi:N-acetylglucosaminyl-diphospho-decaprenol L-rhamnosyltransferase
VSSAMAAEAPACLVDVVIVSYNSHGCLRNGIAPLIKSGFAHVIVVDNASGDGSLNTVADLPVTRLQLPTNRGFAHGCNIGWRAGHAPFVLFLNPDASIDPHSLMRLVEVLKRDSDVGLVAPRILDTEGSLDFSLRRFPRARSTWGRALFLHRFLPHAPWVDEVVRDDDAYFHAGAHEWVSGACMLVRRLALEQIGGLDERFFLYCEDKDLCYRLWAAGFRVHYEPDAVCIHEGGASAPRPSLLPVLAASRLRYTQKHGGRSAIVVERAGLVLEALLRLVVSQGGRGVRGGHARSLVKLVSPRP